MRMKPSSASSAKNQAASDGTHRIGELFLVATPIGHLKDITLRALEVLKTVDCIACEDTRTSGVLLQHYGITTRRVAYHAHNEAEATTALLNGLQQGQRIALISDAGTPLVSDPGQRLVKAAIAADVRVIPIPGASALLSAVTIAGLPPLPLYFGGFLPPKSTTRRSVFAAAQHISATLVWYESPKRLAASLADAFAVLGDRRAAVARELTKLHEECRRESLRDLQMFYENNTPRGECVLLIEGAGETPAPSPEQTDALLRTLLHTHSVKEAAARAATQTGLPKRDLYQRALALK